jgi:hypothetical protein
MHAALQTFPVIYSPKRFGQASLLISNISKTELQCSVWNYDILQVSNYRTRYGHSVVSMGNNIFPNGIMKLQ